MDTVDMDLREVVDRASRGEEGAWKIIVMRFSGLIRRIARAYGLCHSDISDISQIVWMRAFENIAKVRDPRHLGTWIAVVTERECMHLVRKTSNEQLISDHEELDRADDAPALDHRIITREQEEAVRQAINSLPSKGRLLMLLLIAGEKPEYEAVAQKLNMPVGSIGPTRQRCLRLLRENVALRELMDEEAS